ncbi:hypothetical protein CUMW_284500, partial [Citrus unshiu]
MTLSSTMLHRHAICLCRMTPSSTTTTPPRNTVAVPTLHHLNDQVSEVVSIEFLLRCLFHK